MFQPQANSVTLVQAEKAGLACFFQPVAGSKLHGSSASVSQPAGILAAS